MVQDQVIVEPNQSEKKLAIVRVDLRALQRCVERTRTVRQRPD